MFFVLLHLIYETPTASFLPIFRTLIDLGISIMPHWRYTTSNKFLSLCVILFFPLVVLRSEMARLLVPAKWSDRGNSINWPRYPI